MVNNICIFTIASLNYLAHAKTLIHSVKELHDKNVDCFLILVDEVKDLNTNHNNFEIIGAEALGIEGFTEMSFMYDILEFNTALKPFIIKYFLNKGYEKIIYFDPDIMVFNRLDYLFELLNCSQILLTPHATTPHSSQDSMYPIDRSHLISGVFNLGFIAISNGSESRAFLEWWSDRLRENCFFEVEKGLFTDQKWIDLAMCFYESIYVIRNKGCNMSYWNLHERMLNDKFMVNGKEPLIFYHFSGLDLEKINSISKIQNKYTLESRKDLVEIFELYRKKMMDNGYEFAKKQTYKYDYYENGQKIGPLSRRLYYLLKDKYRDPYNTGPGSYYRFLKRRNLLETKAGISSSQIKKDDVAAKIRLANTVLKWTAFIIGANKYDQLLRYMRYVAVLRNQEFLIR